MRIVTSTKANRRDGNIEVRHGLRLLLKTSSEKIRTSYVDLARKMTVEGGS